MMNKQAEKALKMAVKALEDYPYEHRTAKMDDALQACKEALALSEKQYTFPDKKQPEQEPSKLEIAGFELDNVIADMKLSGQFDCVNYDTVVSVRKTIADYVAWQGNKELIGLGDAFEQALKEKNT